MLQEPQMCFEELFESGYVYRYPEDARSYLAKEGQPFPSFQRETEPDATNGIFLEELIQPTVSPVTIDKSQREYLERLSLAWPPFMKAQLKLYRKAKRGQLSPSLCRMIRLCCTEKEWEKGESDPTFRFSQPFVRLDAVMTPEGFKVVDINSTRPAGVGDIILASKVMPEYFEEEVGVMPLEESFLRAVVETGEDWEQEFDREIKQRGVVCLETDGDYHNFMILNGIMKSAGLCSKPITSGQEILSELSSDFQLIRGRIKNGHSLFPLLEKGYPNSACIISPLYRRFIGNKIWMYLVRTSELEAIFREEMGKEAYELVADSFAPVGLVNNGRHLILPQGTLGPVESLKRKEWIFKEPGSSSGRNMVLGMCMGEKKWRGLLPSVREGWIGQRSYHSTVEVSVLNEEGEIKQERMFVKYGIFILGGRFAGMEAMFRRSPLVHGARNTYISPVFFAK